MLETINDLDLTEIDAQEKGILLSHLEDEYKTCVAYNILSSRGYIESESLSYKSQQKEIKQTIKEYVINKSTFNTIQNKLDCIEGIARKLILKADETDMFWNFILVNFSIFLEAYKENNPSNTNPFWDIRCNYSDSPKLQCLTYINLNCTHLLLKKNKLNVQSWIDDYYKNRSLISWIDKADHPKVEWAHEYCKKYFKSRYLVTGPLKELINICNLSSQNSPTYKFQYICLVTIYIITHYSKAQTLLFIKETKGAYSSKKYREKNDGKVSKSFKISKDAANKFAILAQSAQLTHSQFLELMIERVANNEVNLKPRSPLLHEED